MISTSTHGAVRTIVLDRPDRHNALTFAGLAALAEAIHDAEADDAIKVIVLRGAGASFCAGDDLDEIAAAYRHPVAGRPRQPRVSQRERLAIERRFAAVVDAVQTSSTPIIARVHGHCVGMGLYLVECADLALCADGTQFAHTEQRLGNAGNTPNLPGLIVAAGPKRARELLLLCETFDGPTAEQLGIVNRSVPEEQLDALVEQWVARICRHDRDALATGKAAHNMALAVLGIADYTRFASVAHALATNLKRDPT
ncbi:MAG: enoyl-CoA hydratase/isomerase family protein [Ilumatobacteraceae bacterium]